VGKILRKELRPISGGATDAAPKVEVAG